MVKNRNYRNWCKANSTYVCLTVAASSKLGLCSYCNVEVGVAVVDPIPT